MANPSSEHAQLVREGSRELRLAAAEVLEMTERPQAAAAAGLFQAVLSAHHLAPGTSQKQLTAANVATSRHSGPRPSLMLATLPYERLRSLDVSQWHGAEALHVVPRLGRFYWQHLATGHEDWLPALEEQRDLARKTPLRFF